jgi:hypothetical protein
MKTTRVADNPKVVAAEDPRTIPVSTVSGRMADAGVFEPDP